MIRKPDISSFLVYNFQSLPVILGVEYAIPTGIVRTFSDSSEHDFYEVLHRSLGASMVMPDAKNGDTKIFCSPFLGKGVPEWQADISQLLAVNDQGKPIFAAQQFENGTFATSTFGSKDFDTFVQSLF